ncbi:hypothetical protein Y032_0022g544 [Ancylostoma ceylanicum]|uniref:Uncharacterized protein n=1 Tax=Ancylostoma ceylanicum TaxID=53326 RepID=A0A016UZ40_9BILA|nr:hypothetical protein Y032_0022g544 [Ancylostoma ceylanicum]
MNGRLREVNFSPADVPFLIAEFEKQRDVYLPGFDLDVTKTKNVKFQRHISSTDSFCENKSYEGPSNPSHWGGASPLGNFHQYGIRHPRIGCNFTHTTSTSLNQSLTAYFVYFLWQFLEFHSEVAAESHKSGPSKQCGFSWEGN